jgi:maltose O-acetyltransferase
MKDNDISDFLENASKYKKYISVQYFRSHILPMLWARQCLRQATHMGRMVRVWGRPSIKNEGTLVIGERTRLDSRIATLELVVKKGGVLEIRDGSYINYGGSIAAMKRVQIGANCLIGTFAMISDNQFHRLEPERRYELPESSPVILEDNVWLGGRVIVLPGVTIGEGSVIGAGSVVTRDIPPRCVAVGAPAKVVKKL